MTAAAPIYIRPAQVPAMFGISRSTLYRWAAAGMVDLHRHGRMTFVRAEDLRRLIEQGKGQA